MGLSRMTPQKANAKYERFFLRIKPNARGHACERKSNVYVCPADLAAIHGNILVQP
jgi:hypothetical protein